MAGPVPGALCPNCRGYGSTLSSLPKFNLIFVPTLKYLSSRIIASAISSHCQSIEDSLNINIQPQNYSIPLIVEKIYSLFCGNTKLVLQVGIHLDGENLLGLFYHIGGLGAITRDHNFHPDVVSDFFHALKFNHEKYRYWNSKFYMNQELGKAGYYDYVVANLEVMCFDYMREIRKYALSDPTKWQEYELAYYRAGYSNYHIPEFLNEFMLKKLNLQYEGQANSMVNFFANGFYLRDYPNLCPISYDYHAARFTQIKLILGKCVINVRAEDIERYFTKRVHLRSSFDITGPDVVWTLSEANIVLTHPDPSCCCNRADSITRHQSFCQDQAERFFFYLLKRIVAAKVSLRFAEGAFFCLKAATYYEDAQGFFNFRPTTELYLVDVFCHLAECFAGMGLSIDLVLFSLEAAFVKAKYNSCLIQCLSAAHNVMTSLGAFVQANRLFKILEKKKLPPRNHFWFKAFFRQLEGMTEHIENELVNCMLINLYHLNCRPGPCFKAESQNDLFSAGEPNDESDPVYLKFIEGRKLWASWQLPDRYYKMINSLSAKMQKLSTQSVGHHSTFNAIFLNIRYNLLQAGKFLCSGKFYGYRHCLNNVETLISEYNHLRADNSFECTCRLHRAMAVPSYCSCDTITPLLRVKIAAFKLLFGSGFTLPVKTLDDYQVRLSMIEIRIKQLAYDRRDRELMDLYFTQLIVLLVQPRNDSSEFIRHLLFKFDELSMEMERIGAFQSKPQYRRLIVNEVKIVFDSNNSCRHFRSREESRQCLQSSSVNFDTWCCNDDVIVEDPYSKVVAKKWLDELHKCMEVESSDSMKNCKSFFEELSKMSHMAKETFSLGYFYTICMDPS